MMGARGHEKTVPTLRFLIFFWMLLERHTKT